MKTLRMSPQGRRDSITTLLLSLLLLLDNALMPLTSFRPLKETVKHILLAPKPWRALERAVGAFLSRGPVMLSVSSSLLTRAHSGKEGREIWTLKSTISYC
jgi:hypothetical protein